MTGTQARRLALAATGLARPRPTGRTDARGLRRMAGTLGVIQLDSVNVVCRAHYLPAWSRLGGYPRDRLDALAYRDRELFEYWGHEASLLPVGVQPLLRWRMRRARELGETWGGMARLAREQPELVGRVLDAVAERGPVTAGELAGPGERVGGWWSWSAAKTALEWLFWTGQVAAAHRVHFERRYDLPARVLPAAVLAAPTPPEPDARAELLVLAARSLGVATGADLADYYRMRGPDLPGLLAGLVRAGRLVRGEVAGWRAPAYVADGTLQAPLPRVARGRGALISPFDPLVWSRPRALRLFGLDYRLEIYTPAARRRHGYYVLPFLLGDAFAARVDLKADRSAGCLRVPAAWVEPGADVAAVVPALAAELTGFARWLGLGQVAVGERGELAGRLARVV